MTRLTKTHQITEEVIQQAKEAGRYINLARPSTAGSTGLRITGALAKWKTEMEKDMESTYYEPEHAVAGTREEVLSFLESFNNYSESEISNYMDNSLCPESVGTPENPGVHYKYFQDLVQEAKQNPVKKPSPKKKKDIPSTGEIINAFKEHKKQLDNTKRKVMSLSDKVNEAVKESKYIDVSNLSESGAGSSGPMDAISGTNTRSNKVCLYDETNGRSYPFISNNFKNIEVAMTMLNYEVSDVQAAREIFEIKMKEKDEARAEQDRKALKKKEEQEERRRQSEARKKQQNSQKSQSRTSKVISGTSRVTGASSNHMIPPPGLTTPGAPSLPSSIVPKPGNTTSALPQKPSGVVKNSESSTASFGSKLPQAKALPTPTSLPQKSNGIPQQHKPGSSSLPSLGQRNGVGSQQLNGGMHKKLSAAQPTTGNFNGVGRTRIQSR